MYDIFVVFLWRDIVGSNYELGARESTVASISQIDHAAFDLIVATKFPDAAAELDAEDRELLHTEMAAVARSTCRAIDTGDKITEANHFAIMQDVFNHASPEVENAVYVSYLENLFLGEERAEYLAARARLPAVLARALLKLEEHFARLGGSARGA